MFPAGPSGNFGGQAEGANSTMQVCYIVVLTPLTPNPFKDEQLLHHRMLYRD